MTPNHSEKDMPSQTPREITTEEFMKHFAIVKEWFKMEEIDVSDLTLGRMASRLGQELHQVESSARDKAWELGYNEGYEKAKKELQ